MAKRVRKRRLRTERLVILFAGALLAVLLFVLCIWGIVRLITQGGNNAPVPAEPTPTPDPTYKNDYDWQNLSSEEGILHYEDEQYTSSFGIDVSQFQQTVDWQKIKAAGAEFAIIRAGYRGSSEGILHEDPLFRANIEGALNAGLEVSVYFFSQAVSEEEAAEEAGFLLNLIKDYPVYECVYDLEYGSENDRASENDQDMNTAAAVSFCNTIRQSGYHPIVYGNKSFMYHEIRMWELQDIAEFWLAGYGTDTPEFPYVFSIWQYSCDGEIDGVDTVVDFNIRFIKK